MYHIQVVYVHRLGFEGEVLEDIAFDANIGKDEMGMVILSAYIRIFTAPCYRIEVTYREV